MAKSPWRQKDAERLAKAVNAAGYRVARIEVAPDGRLIAVTTDDPEAKTPPRNDWD